MGCPELKVTNNVTIKVITKFNKKGARVMYNQDYEKKKNIDLSYESTTGTNRSKKYRKKLILLIMILVIVVAARIFSTNWLFGGQKKKTEILTISELKKIINISELSTFQAVYNGIANVMNEKKSDQVDYYVSYEAKIYAGFDLDKVKIIKDEEAKKITVTIPEIKITDVVVDIASLDYMFQNNKANTNTVSEQAYKACIADVTSESKKESRIYDLAKQNAKNIMEALISPFIKQLDSDYKLEIN